MKTLYVVSENQVIDGYQKYVEIRQFLDREVAESYIEKHQNLREEECQIPSSEWFSLETVGQMKITESPIYETVEEAERVHSDTDHGSSTYRPVYKRQMPFFKSSGGPMSVSYERLFYLLDCRGLTKKDLMEMAGIGNSTMAKLANDEIVSMEVMTKICSVLQCELGDAMEIFEDD